MRALVVREPGRYAIEDIPEPAVPARLVHRLPARRPLEPAALLEPAACVARPGRPWPRRRGATRVAAAADQDALAALAAPGGDAVKVLVRPER